MSTHNIGSYEDLTRIIFELSSIIIKYAPYFFWWFNFRKDRGTINMIFTAIQQGKCQEQNVDLTKAFDTVSRDGRWKI